MTFLKDPLFHKPHQNDGGGVRTESTVFSVIANLAVFITITSKYIGSKSTVNRMFFFIVNATPLHFTP